MTIYTVYIPPQTSDNAGNQHLEAVLIPDAPSFMALVLPFFWLIWHRLWWPVLFYALLTITFLLLLPTSLNVIVAGLTILPGFYLFLEGQELRRKKLERGGWTLAATIEEQDMNAAEYRYFHSVLESQKPSLTPGFTQAPSSGTAQKPFAPVDSGIEFPGTTELS